MLIEQDRDDVENLSGGKQKIQTFSCPIASFSNKHNGLYLAAGSSAPLGV